MSHHHPTVCCHPLGLGACTLLTHERKRWQAAASDASDPRPLARPLTSDPSGLPAAGSPESPLAAIASWVNTTDAVSGLPARRETSTMPQWAGSCWYYLRFVDPANPGKPIDPELEKYW